MIYITILGLGLLSCLNFMVCRELLYPAFIQSFTWFVVTLLYAMFSFFNNNIPQLSDKVNMVFLGGSILFSLGCYNIIKRYHPIPPNKMHLMDLSKSKYYKIIVWLPIVGLPFYYLKLQAISSIVGTSNFFWNLRHAFTNEDLSTEMKVNIGLYIYLNAFAFAAYFLQLFQKEKSVWLYLSGITAIIYSVLSTGRASMAILIVVSFGILYYSGKFRMAYGIITVVCAGLIVFLVLGALRGLGGDAEFRENMDIAINSIWAYFLGAIAAFDVLLSDCNIHLSDYQSDLFYFIYRLLNKFGLNIQIRPVLQPFQTIGNIAQVNTYTIYRSLYSSFSYWGLILMFYLGSIHTWLYMKAKSGDPLKVFIFCVSIYPLFMQIIEDQYFTILSTWFQIIILFYIGMENKFRMHHL